MCRHHVLTSARRGLIPDICEAIRSDLVAETHPAVWVASPLVGRAGRAGAQHLPRSPPRQPHQFGLLSAGGEPTMRHRVPELVRVDRIQARVLAAALELAVDDQPAEELLKRPVVLGNRGRSDPLMHLRQIPLEHAPGHRREYGIPYSNRPQPSPAT